MITIEMKHTVAMTMTSRYVVHGSGEGGRTGLVVGKLFGSEGEGATDVDLILADTLRFSIIWC